MVYPMQMYTLSPESTTTTFFVGKYGLWLRSKIGF